MYCTCREKPGSQNGTALSQAPFSGAVLPYRASPRATLAMMARTYAAIWPLTASQPMPQCSMRK